MAAVVAGVLGVGGVWLLWKHTLGAGPFKGAIVLEVQVRHPMRSGLSNPLCLVASQASLCDSKGVQSASVRPAHPPCAVVAGIVRLGIAPTPPSARPAAPTRTPREQPVAHVHVDPSISAYVAQGWRVGGRNPSSKDLS